jgi:hypothetical protein
MREQRRQARDLARKALADVLVHSVPEPPSWLSPEQVQAFHAEFDRLRERAVGSERLSLARGRVASA